ncbi:MAG: DUF3310 domain-containing protein [Mycetocola sp.]
MSEKVLTGFLEFPHDCKRPNPRDHAFGWVCPECGERWYVVTETGGRRRSHYESRWERSSSPAGKATTQPDPVAHPTHYTSDPSGIECIQITRHRNFNIGNAIKYLWRAGRKNVADLTSRQKELEDLRKATWYINDEIGRLEQETE